MIEYNARTSMQWCVPCRPPSLCSTHPPKHPNATPIDRSKEQSCACDSPTTSSLALSRSGPTDKTAHCTYVSGCRHRRAAARHGVGQFLPTIASCVADIWMRFSVREAAICASLLPVEVTSQGRRELIRRRPKIIVLALVAKTSLRPRSPPISSLLYY